VKIELNISNAQLLEKLVSFSTNYEYFSIHCSNEHEAGHDVVCGFGARQVFSTLNEIDSNDNSWKFGLVSYDAKNNFEKLHSQHTNFHKLNEVCFFVPEIVIKYNNGILEIISDKAGQENLIADKIKSISYEAKAKQNIPLIARTNKEDYIKNVNTLKNHIQLGDIYEINYCIDFYNENTEADCNELFLELNKISQAPFACYTRFKDNVIICSSPERFLKKVGNKLITQPIKGTAARGNNDTEEEKIKEELYNNKKERNENVMIVDVSRNDLSRLATKGSVKVDELFSIKTYKQVHQMVSTISCELKANSNLESIFAATFPPASMTGAPKIRAMQLIDEHENFRRGAYSGSIGFIEPNGDFDFNVVIRSIVYNTNNKHLSYSVGSAITAKCDAEKEYEECMLKAKAMKEILEG